MWGPFSIVWGLALALVTLFLYKYKDRSESFLFLTGTLLGGAYEYLCSVFTEIVFGKVFWDYSGIPFNLGGRINLLYCFFWGIAAVIWFKKFFPKIEMVIEKIPVKFGKAVIFLRNQFSYNTGNRQVWKGSYMVSACVYGLQYICVVHGTCKI